MIKKIPEGMWPYIFIAPWIVGFIVFTFVPFFQTIRFSFNNVLISAQGLVLTPVGLGNYNSVLFSHPEITEALVDMFFILLITVPLVLVFSLIIALLLNSNVKGTGIYRTIFFLPVIIMSGAMLQMLIDNNIMVLPTFANFAEWVSTSDAGFFFNLIAKILNGFVFILWCTGVPVLIFLSSLQKINTSVYEAAEIDGATGWESFWKITFPNLRPILLVNMLYTTIFIATLELNPVIEAIDANLFNAKTGIGFTSAIAWIYFILIVIVLIILGGLINGGFRSKNR